MTSDVKHQRHHDHEQTAEDNEAEVAGRPRVLNKGRFNNHYDHIGISWWQQAAILQIGKSNKPPGSGLGEGEVGPVFAVAAERGTGLAAGGDQIAERTGLGRLFVGTVLLAFATSLPELVTDITAAATGAPDLAVIDLSGSSMANMAILAIIDLDYRGRVWPAVELGHARVAAVAIVLTALAALGLHTPPGAAIGWVGISTIMILCVYLAAIAGFAACDDRRGRGRGPWLIPPGADRVIRAAGRPLGQADRHPVRCGYAGDTRRCSIDDDRSRADSRVEWESQTSIGVILLAGSTSLPELAASLAVLRIGADDLAVGNLFGSNAANMAVLLFADLAYTEGPILSAVSGAQTVAALGAIPSTALAVVAIVGGTETRIRRFEPDALVLLIAYIGALAAVALVSST